MRRGVGGGYIADIANIARHRHAEHRQNRQNRHRPKIANIANIASIATKLNPTLSTPVKLNSEIHLGERTASIAGLRATGLGLLGRWR